MSYKNPTVSEVLANSCDTKDMAKHLHKSYLNLTKGKFFSTHKRKATLDDAQELFDLYVNHWYYIIKVKPTIENHHREIATPVWKFGCSIKIDVQDASREFVRTKNPNWDGIFNYHYDSWIIENGYFEEFKTWAFNNKKDYKYYKPRYIDFSNMAYNNSSDDY